MTAERPKTPMLILVVGAGRSGTSTAAGTLARIGFAVPQPEVPADETNPRGFFEPQWVVDFHKRVLGDLGVRTNDARPEAVERAAQVAAMPELVDELTGWLAPLIDRERVVVKDPRTLWLLDLWRKAAGNVGFDLAYLTMLRHPAEVARSRDTHYLSGRDPDFRRARETTNVASWCHGTLITELATRGDRRAFVPYHDLMSDWRATMRRVDEQLGAGLLEGITDAPHSVDNFIDTTLNRSQVSWDDLAAHAEVRELAQQTWEVVNQLVVDPADATAESALDDVHQRYDSLYGLARDLTLDQTSTDREAHRRAQRQTREEAAKRVRKLRARVKRLQARVTAAEQRNAELSSQLEHAQRSLVNRVVRRLGNR